MCAEDNQWLKDLGTADLCRRCREQYARYRAGEPCEDRFSFELFRRAIVERDDHCWREIVAIYDGIVRSWCRRVAYDCAGDLDELVALTWEKFWRHFTADKLYSAGTTGRALSYLKLCARSVVLDTARKSPSAMPLDGAVAGRWDATPASGDLYGDEMDHAALWQVVDQHLHNDHERVLIHLRFELGLKPVEVLVRRPDLFPSIRDVYRVTRNVLDRLRHSPAMRAWRTDQCA